MTTCAVIKSFRYACFLILILASGWASAPSSHCIARELVGEQGDRLIRFDTEIHMGREYVQALAIIDYFQDRWRYEGLTGTLIFYRPDGVRIGLQVGDPRLLAGTRVIHAGAATIRIDDKVYIPYSIVNSHLFPDVTFELARDFTGLEEQPTPTSDPSDFLFYTPIPVESPTEIPFAFAPFGAPTPAPTPARDVWERPSREVIVLDPGHDPRYPGASSPGGVREWEITHAICNQIAYILREDTSYEVVITYTRDAAEPATNFQRAAVANRNDGAILVSIQCGIMHSDAISRAEVFFMNDLLDAPFHRGAGTAVMDGLQSWDLAYQRFVPQSRDLAGAIHSRLARFFATAGVIATDDAPRPARLALLRGLDMPGVVVELGNLAEPQTARYLSTRQIQNGIAEVIATGILNYMHEQTGLASTAGATR